MIKKQNLKKKFAKAVGNGKLLKRITVRDPITNQELPFNVPELQKLELVASV
jgi:hypothetical protein